MSRKILPWPESRLPRSSRRKRLARTATSSATFLKIQQDVADDSCRGKQPQRGWRRRRWFGAWVRFRQRWLGGSRGRRRRGDRRLGRFRERRTRRDWDWWVRRGGGGRGRCP